MLCCKGIFKFASSRSGLDSYFECFRLNAIFRVFIFECFCLSLGALEIMLPHN